MSAAVSCSTCSSGKRFTEPSGVAHAARDAEPARPPSRRWRPRAAPVTAPNASRAATIRSRKRGVAAAHDVAEHRRAHLDVRQLGCSASSTAAPAGCIGISTPSALMTSTRRLPRSRSTAHHRPPPPGPAWPRRAAARGTAPRRRRPRPRWPSPGSRDVAPHHLDHEGAPVGPRGVGDVVARLDDGVERGVDADGTVAVQPMSLSMEAGTPITWTPCSRASRWAPVSEPLPPMTTSPSTPADRSERGRLCPTRRLAEAGAPRRAEHRAALAPQRRRARARRAARRAWPTSTMRPSMSPS